VWASPEVEISGGEVRIGEASNLAVQQVSDFTGPGPGSWDGLLRDGLVGSDRFVGEDLWD